LGACLQVPESLNESSYKADADLSSDGHKQAETLKNFLVDYRKQQQESGTEDKPRPLTVSYFLMCATQGVAGWEAFAYAG
jgi:hypothetical protein